MYQCTSNNEDNLSRKVFGLEKCMPKYNDLWKINIFGLS